MPPYLPSRRVERNALHGVDGCRNDGAAVGAVEGAAANHVLGVIGEIDVTWSRRPGEKGDDCESQITIHFL